MKRLLLLIPTTTYRTEDFVEAARKLDVDLVIASDRPNVMSAEFPDHLLTLSFSEPEAAAKEIGRFAERRPLDAVVPVDDLTTEVAAAIGQTLGLRANPIGAVSATRNKLRMRELLARSGLSASRGVIRADSEPDFVAAFERIRAILRSPEVSDLGEGTDRILVEAFIPGTEVALEGLLEEGRLHTLALFDKPDPLDGPFFEETIYVTPSRLPEPASAAIRDATARAASALGLYDGPVHAELRVNQDGRGRDTAWMIEIAARSIGGLCSRTLSFGTGMSLEEIILRHALGLPIASLERDRRAAGVMMIPIPQGGILEEVQGLDEARAVPLIEDVTISIHKGQVVVPLPEGSRYLGFIFSRADTPAEAEAALRRAHAQLRFVIR